MNFKIMGFIFLTCCYFYKGKQLSAASCLLAWMIKHSKIQSTLKGKNLLLEEQILSFKSWLSLRRVTYEKLAQLLPLSVYPVTLNFI